MYLLLWNTHSRAISLVTNIFSASTWTCSQFLGSPRASSLDVSTSNT